ncbi:MAG: hypothetical protein A2381_03370 [Bdellovibrionales bacterium RIFOXYB1_FULL_37_110]|nr:MAG: hypothetical protein A2181_00475 [Bdellovibrionales bacterium RIFOXYA1_FULL_38_20]OFZ48445.1 MAG: hypothetical protein A2417_03860 [Bdellovibrionales bacterium RIFOXYC1_FULL_37_79]OFZ57966.1 MAG: hypothetical protein A2381_03370 [Bdellovibrionales bacterium RIFOXYB1_FULL_37_110]OFZ63103.1 MAG: hypothetical protein A2577_15500 [Bdellovibrionales bacterium RIFOXYD1_FULL_36_51]OFZ63573.1 MAG: hypothetical protein A2328_09530 [Bdellovibrionales bacterium RIFOXYB2_FULL_36_6]
MEKKKDKKTLKPARTIEKSQDTGKTVYIGNLNYKRDEEGIKFLFSKYGKVKSVEIIIDPDNDKKLGYAFVRMYRTSEAIKAIKGLNGKIVDGRTLKVSEAKERFPEKAPLGEKEIIKASPKKRPVKRKKKTGNLQKLFDYLKKK